jgi:hypothetical protein
MANDFYQRFNLNHRGRVHFVDIIMCDAIRLKRLYPQIVE